ncbi:hypothetical protein GN244_ATG19892 [Phytophthora infestans]|uniref:Uncharacterized protein n=1 Tax=Phytophthora infestans TaxID=4787 RepID=A0A833WCK0_PHYIN|nr:hypothetical protein GN244_ATG19892 [Phytophthora infestans]
MGRPPSASRTHFVKVPGVKANKSHYFVRCKHCLAAHAARSKARMLQNSTSREPDSPLPDTLVGRVENFRRHLLRYHDIVKEDGPSGMRPLPPPLLPMTTLHQRRKEEDSDQQRHTSLSTDVSLSTTYLRIYPPATAPV